MFAPCLVLPHGRCLVTDVHFSEPGLYYLDAGGIRIEDVVVVTHDGCRLLTQAPKVLEV